MGNLRPTFCASSVAEINFEALTRSMPQLAGVAFDLDKTLVGQHEAKLPIPHLDALAAIDSLGLKLGIISNAASQERTDRVRAMADSISKVIGSELVVVTSRMVGGRKKPLRPIFDKFSDEIAIKNDRLIYVGDQLFKDVLGANRAGYAGTVLVAAYGHGDDPRVRYLQRPIEAIVRPFVGAPFLSKRF